LKICKQSNKQHICVYVYSRQKRRVPCYQIRTSLLFMDGSTRLTGNGAPYIEPTGQSYGRVSTQRLQESRNVTSTLILRLYFSL